MNNDLKCDALRRCDEGIAGLPFDESRPAKLGKGALNNQLGSESGFHPAGDAPEASYDVGRRLEVGSGPLGQLQNFILEFERYVPVSDHMELDVVLPVAFYRFNNILTRISNRTARFSLVYTGRILAFEINLSCVSELAPSLTLTKVDANEGVHGIEGRLALSVDDAKALIEFLLVHFCPFDLRIRTT